LVVAALGPLLARWSASALAKAILKGVNAGVVALLISMVITSGERALIDGLDNFAACRRRIGVVLFEAGALLVSFERDSRGAGNRAALTSVQLGRG